MKAIFLDIDGVLTSARIGWYNMDIYAIHFLIWVCERTGCKIVISSTWRYNHDREFWQMIFGDCVHEDYKTKDIVRNEDTGERCDLRGEEIAEWLSRHPEVDDYIILDDDTDFLESQKIKTVITESLNGIMFKDMQKIIDIFDIRGYPHEDKKIIKHYNMFAESRVTKLEID